MSLAPAPRTSPSGTVRPVSSSAASRASASAGSRPELAGSRLPPRGHASRALAGAGEGGSPPFAPPPEDRTLLRKSRAEAHVPSLVAAVCSCRIAGPGFGAGRDQQGGGVSCRRSAEPPGPKVPETEGRLAAYDVLFAMALGATRTGGIGQAKPRTELRARTRKDDGDYGRNEARGSWAGTGSHVGRRRCRNTRSGVGGRRRHSQHEVCARQRIATDRPRGPQGPDRRR